MKHAFLIMVHDSPELLEKIVNRIDSPNHFVFIHVDKKVRDKFEYSGGGQILDKSLSVSHGGYSMIETEIELLKKAFSSSEHFDYFHLISGHDYPCKTMKQFDTFFEKHQGESFMHFDSAEEHVMWQDKISRRVNNWHFLDSGLPRYIRKLSELILDVIHPRNKYDGELYAGWQWFSWHRSVAEFVLSYLSEHPSYLERFKYTSCCDEVFFHTLLQPYLVKLNITPDNSLRYVDWKPKRHAESLPLILDERDANDVDSCSAFFCRKVFLGRSTILINHLDRVLIDEDKNIE